VIWNRRKNRQIIKVTCLFSYPYQPLAETSYGHGRLDPSYLAVDNKLRFLLFHYLSISFVNIPEKFVDISREIVEI
jgi:hypothetical protein